MKEAGSIPRCVRCGAELPATSTDDVCADCRLTLSDAPTVRSVPPTEVSRTALAKEATRVVTGGGEATLLRAESRESRGDVTLSRLTSGDVYGPYRIVLPLGSGGMGHVYEAEHLEHGRRVAVKVLNERMADGEARRRFLREGELAAAVSSPHTVYIFGSEEIRGAPAIAMELLTGGTLKDRVQQGGPLPVRAAVDAIVQVIEGLRALLAQDILHLDIKPANCFITSDGIIKVGDFGVSMSRRAGRVQARGGRFQGTPQFAAPEQLRGEPLDARADIYAVGATLFYLLTGRAPFDDPDLGTLITRVQTDVPRSAHQIRPAVPKALAAVVAQCLAKNRDDRPIDYDHLMALIEPFSSRARQPAGLGRRSAAGLLDRILLGALVAPFDFAIFYVMGARHADVWVSVLQLAADVVYFGILEGLWGLTLGKAVFGLRVSAPDGRPPGLLLASARAGLFLVPVAITSSLWLAASGAAATRLTVQNPSVTPLFWALQGLLLTALFAPARAINGFAAWHDRLTETRVVRAGTTQAGELAQEVADLRPADRQSSRRIGPFDVVAAVGATDAGDVLLGFDPRLRRRVWIIQHATGGKPARRGIRDVARPARLRWLGGQQTATEPWDAFEALDGQPLVRLDEPRSWSSVSRWMRELGIELGEGLADQSIPALALDRVWITRQGSARLLDFRAPGAPVDPHPDQHPTARSAQRFLAQVAARGLEGAPSLSGRAVSPVILPLSVRRALDQLVAPGFRSFSEIVANFSALQGTATHVSMARRGAAVALGLLAPVTLALLGIFTAILMQRAPAGADALALLLPRLARLPQAAAGAVPDTEREALETVIAGRFADTIANPVTWALSVNGVQLGPYKGLAEDVLARHPHVTGDALRSAEKALGPFYDTVAAADGRTIRRAQTALGLLPEYLGLVGLAVAAAVGLLSGAVFRGGLVLRLLGVAVVTRRGSRTSALRGGLRALIAWFPAALVVYWASAADIHFNGTYSVARPVMLWYAAAALGAFGAGAAVAVFHPTRGIQDYLSATWIVPS